MRIIRLRRGGGQGVQPELLAPLSAAYGDERDVRRRCLPERLANTLTGESRVRVPVELPDQLTAVLVAEVESDVTGIQLAYNAPYEDGGIYSRPVRNK